MTRKTMYLSATALALWALSLPAHSQSDSISIPAAILACADEMDVMRRLSCYDREIAAARMPAEPTEAATSPQPVAAPITAAATGSTAVEAVPEPDSRSDRVQSASQPSDGDGGADPDISDEAITAKVVEIRERPYGELVIRLDNGQVWEQKHVDRRFRLEIGESVRITKGAVSGYRLSGRGNRSIQVDRRN